MMEKYIEITEIGNFSFSDLVIGMTKDECLGMLKLKGIDYLYGTTKEVVGFCIVEKQNIGATAKFDVHDRLVELTIHMYCDPDIDVKPDYEKTKEKISKLHRPRFPFRSYDENVVLHFDIRNDIVDIQLLLSECSRSNTLILDVRMGENIYSDWRNNTLNVDSLFSNYCEMISRRSLPKNNELKANKAHIPFYKSIKWQHVAIFVFCCFLVVYALNTRYQVYKDRRVDKWFGTIERLEKIDNKTNKDNKKLRTLYDALTKDGYELGSFEQFSEAMNNEGSRKLLYKTMKMDKWNVGDYNSFSKNVLGF